MTSSQTNWLSRNIIANFLGRGWSALISLALVPVYIKFLGIEAFGLVGVFTSLVMIFSVLDMGLSTTMNREIARYSAQPGHAQETRNLVRTLEVVYWIMGAAICTVIVMLAPLIATHWIKTTELSSSTVQLSIIIMGFVLASRWPLSLYSGGLMGLQRQVQLNVVIAGMATVRGFGAVLVLWLVSPTVQAYFCWLVVIGVLETATMALLLWHSLPAGNEKPRFRKASLFSVRRFAVGMSGITIVNLILTQTDKVILSRLLPLEMFGYYSLALVVASSLLIMITPLFSALFPSFTTLTALSDQATLKRLYHRGCQLMSLVVLPAAIVMSLFSPELLLLWTKDPVAVQNTYQLVSLLVIGTALNGLVTLPYALQLAHGWTKLTFYKNLLAIASLVPTTIVLTLRYDAIGAAAVWVILNSGYVLIELPIMHRRLLRGELKRWYLVDVGLPLFAMMPVALMGRWLIHDSEPGFIMLINIGAVWLVSVFAAAMAAPEIRMGLLRRVRSEKVVYDGA